MGRRDLGRSRVDLLAVAAIILLFATWACSLGTQPASSDLPAPTAPHQPAGNISKATGELVIQIRWPVRDLPGFKAASIPLSTSALGITIKKSDEIVLQQSIQRPSGGGTTTLRLPLQAANNLTVEVKAYREANPDLANAIPIAQGSAVGVNIQASQTSRAAITLTALTAPNITGLLPNAARVGDVVIVSGTNLGFVGGVAPVVSIGSATASAITQAGNSLRVTIPPGATVGNVTVRSDGLISESAAMLFVLENLVIDAPREAWDNGPPGTRMVYYGKALQFTAKPTFVLPAGSSLIAFGTPPSPTWVSSAVQAAQANSIDSAGVFTAATLNKATTLTAALGSVLSNAIVATAVGVDGVALSTSSFTVNGVDLAKGASASWAALTAVNVGAIVKSSLPYNSGVDWSLSDATLISMNASTQSAVVQAQNGAPEGTTTVIAKAKDDARIAATASVSVTNLGGLVLEVE